MNRKMAPPGYEFSVYYFHSLTSDLYIFVCVCVGCMSACMCALHEHHHVKSSPLFLWCIIRDPHFRALYLILNYTVNPLLIVIAFRFVFIIPQMRPVQTYSSHKESSFHQSSYYKRCKQYTAAVCLTSSIIVVAQYEICAMIFSTIYTFSSGGQVNQISGQVEFWSNLPGGQVLKNP